MLNNFTSCYIKFSVHTGYFICFIYYTASKPPPKYFKYYIVLILYFSLEMFLTNHVYFDMVPVSFDEGTAENLLYLADVLY